MCEENQRPVKDTRTVEELVRPPTCSRIHCDQRVRVTFRIPESWDACMHIHGHGVVNVGVSGWFRSFRDGEREAKVLLARTARPIFRRRNQ